MAVKKKKPEKKEEAPKEEAKEEAPKEEVKKAGKKKKEKVSQKEKPKSKKKHAKVQVWKLYEVKDGKATRKNAACQRCGSGTFLATFKNRKYCGKCGWAQIEKQK